MIRQTDYDNIEIESVNISDTLKDEIKKYIKEKKNISFMPLHATITINLYPTKDHLMDNARMRSYNFTDHKKLHIYELELKTKTTVFSGL